MDERASPREKYLYEEFEDTPITDAEREELRGYLRSLLCNVTEYKAIEPEHSAILNITVTRPNEVEIGVEVDILEKELDVEIIPDERFHPDGTVERFDEPPYNLRDLGPEWESLEYDLISEMVLMLDLPEYTDELSNYAFGEDFGITCTTAGRTAVFTTWFRIPPTTRMLYDEDQFDIAERLGIPMLD